MQQNAQQTQQLQKILTQMNNALPTRRVSYVGDKHLILIIYPEKWLSLVVNKARVCWLQSLGELPFQHGLSD